MLIIPIRPSCSSLKYFVVPASSVLDSPEFTTCLWTRVVVVAVVVIVLHRIVGAGAEDEDEQQGGGRERRCFLRRMVSCYSSIATEPAGECSPYNALPNR